MKIVARAVKELRRGIGLCKGHCLADAAGDQGQDRPGRQVPPALREVDYAAARRFWHPEIIIGT